MIDHQIWHRFPLQGFTKDETRLIIQKLRTRSIQRQLFLIITSFEEMPAILCLGKELGLTTEVVILREDEENIPSHKVTGTWRTNLF